MKLFFVTPLLEKKKFVFKYTRFLFFPHFHFIPCQFSVVRMSYPFLPFPYPLPVLVLVLVLVSSLTSYFLFLFFALFLVPVFRFLWLEFFLPRPSCSIFLVLFHKSLSSKPIIGHKRSGRTTFDIETKNKKDSRGHRSLEVHVPGNEVGVCARVCRGR